MYSLLLLYCKDASLYNKGRKLQIIAIIIQIKVRWKSFCFEKKKKNRLGIADLNGKGGGFWFKCQPLNEVQDIGGGSW